MLPTWPEAPVDILGGDAHPAPAKFVVLPKRVYSEQQIEELRSLFKREIGSVRPSPADAQPAV